MRFHSHDRTLDKIPHRRTFGEELRMALSAIDCTLDGEKGCYASTALTTGPRFYDLLREYGLRDAGALKERLGAEGYERRLWQSNLEEAATFARRLRQLLDCQPVVSPAPFVASGWSQPEYLAFWEAFLRTRARAIYLNDGWQYSRGCTYELVIAGHCGLPAFDAEARPLRLAAAAQMITEAVTELCAEGIEPLGLTENLAALEELRRGTRSSGGSTP